MEGEPIRKLKLLVGSLFSAHTQPLIQQILGYILQAGEACCSWFSFSCLVFQDAIKAGEKGTYIGHEVIVALKGKYGSLC